ncbi:MAG: hypothetical protein ACRCYY_03035 [Trueperaceae bacterium]
MAKVWNWKVLSVVVLLVSLLSCGKVPTATYVDEKVPEPGSAGGLDALGMCSDMVSWANEDYPSNSRSVSQTQTEKELRFDTDVFVNRFKDALYESYGDRFSVCWKTVHRRDNIYTAIAYVGADVVFTVSFKPCSQPKSLFEVCLPRDYLVQKQYASTAYPGRTVTATADLGHNMLSKVYTDSNDKSKIYDYPEIGSWWGSDSWEAMFAFASVPASSSLKLDPLLQAQSASTVVAVNRPNAPRVSIQQVMNDGTIQAQAEAECASQRYPNDPCPETDPPPTVIPNPAPPPSAPEPTACEKENCGTYLVKSAWNAGNVALSASGTFTLATGTVAVCVAPITSIVACGGAALVTGGSAAYLAEAGDNLGKSMGDYWVCRSRNEACNP